MHILFISSHLLPIGCMYEQFFRDLLIIFTNFFKAINCVSYVSILSDDDIKILATRLHTHTRARTHAHTDDHCST